MYNSLQVKEKLSNRPGKRYKDSLGDFVSLPVLFLWDTCNRMIQFLPLHFASVLFKTQSPGGRTILTGYAWAAQILPRSMKSVYCHALFQ